MSERANSDAQTCEENSHATLNAVDDLENLPPRTISYTGRRPRFGTGNVPLSPYILIDGRKLRSAIAFTKKWPPRRVSFPTNDSHLVTGYLEPANPWKLAENVNRQDLIAAYKESCVRHNTDPLESVLGQLENLEISENRSEQLDLKGERLDQHHSEPLEEILKRVQFNKLDLEGTSLDDESSVILFDMLEYYESARHLNISSNQDIGIRGWQACAHMVKKTQCLEQLEAKDVTLNEQYMNILCRALRLVCHLHVLKLENCGLSGRPMVILVTALKMNTGIRELYLADNGLDLYDAIQLGSLLRLNSHLQLLDVSNNNIQDDGVRDMLEGLINQVNEDKDGKGLNILILWNNQLTRKSCPFFCRIITHSKTLETINVGKNALTDELLHTVKDALKKNRVLLQLGMQSTELTCDGVAVLSDIIQTNDVLQRIDLRDNTIQCTGMKALGAAMKTNKSITQIDLDDKPRIRIQDGTLHDYMELVAEIRGNCAENEKNRTLEESNDGSESPQHYSRFCSASSRKISLTCQTLPCSSPSTTPVQSDEPGRSMLKPKRASGGRLRSPAPSPIPSPAASPIPSPSRSRFVVSRVPEASLRSTDSSASSSPVTPPSLGSSKTIFFSSPEGYSKLRDLFVESASTVPSPKSVVTSTKGNVTIGFNFKLDTVESTDSDDSDSVFKSELRKSSDVDVGSSSNDTTRDESCLVPDVVICESDAPTDECIDISNRDRRDSSLEEKTSVTRPQDERNSAISKETEHCDVAGNQRTALIELDGATGNVNDSIKDNYNESTNYVENATNIKEDSINNRGLGIAGESLNNPVECDATSETTNDAFFHELAKKQSQTKQNSSVQKHTSNLEKLLELFQHPGSFFSDSSTNITQVENKSTFQDSVSSIMSFGDKFHHYLKEGREKVVSHGTWSSDEPSLAAKAKPMKSSITQLSGFQSLTNMFSSFKLDANLNLFEQSAKSCPKVDEHQSINSLIEGDSEKNPMDKDDIEYKTVDNSGTRELNVYTTEGETNDSISVKQSLPDDVQSRNNDGHTNKDLAIDENFLVPKATADSCSRIVNISPLLDIPESKTTVCTPKLTNIPEYSVLKITENNVKRENLVELVEKVDVVVEKPCDRTLTDSINLTSDSNSSSCNISCDIKIINNVNTILEPTESTEHSVSINLNSKEGGENNSTLNTPIDTSSHISNRESNVNNSTQIYQVQAELSIEKFDSRSNEVTSIRSADNHGEVNLPESQNETVRQSVDVISTYHTNNLTHEKSTIVNNNSELRVENVSVTLKDNNSEVKPEDTDTRRPELALSTEHSIEISKQVNFEETNSSMEDVTSKISRNSSSSSTQSTVPAQGDYYLMKSAANETVEKMSETTSVPRLIFTHHRASSNASMEKENSLADAEKSDTEDLIFCMTDISTDAASIDDELSPGTTTSSNWSTGSNKSTTPVYDLPQTSRSPSSLLIERPEQAHRNSQDSGIGEGNLSAAEDVVLETNQTCSRGSLQESVDSGIDSECSSVYIKSDTYTEVLKEEASFTTKHTNDRGVDRISEDVPELGHHQSTRNSNLESKNDAPHTIEKSTCSGIIQVENVPIGLIIDDNSTVADSSSTIKCATSSK